MMGDPNTLCDFCSHPRKMHHDQEKCVYCHATKRHGAYCEDGPLCSCIQFLEPELSEEDIAALMGETA
jgi:hypothetical protein